MAEAASTGPPYAADGGDRGVGDPAQARARQAQDKAREVKEQAADQARQAAGQAADQARQAAGQARDRVREQVDRRSTQAGEQVGRQASDLREVGEQLRRQGKDGPARIADQVAERTERVGAWLTESDADRILGDVEDFGRRNPWAVMAGGLALGIAASRMLKASSTRRYEQRSGNGLATNAGPAGAPGAPAATEPLSPATAGTAGAVDRGSGADPPREAHSEVSLSAGVVPATGPDTVPDPAVSDPAIPDPAVPAEDPLGRPTGSAGQGAS